MKKVLIGMILLASVGLVAYTWYTFAGKSKSAVSLQSGIAPGTSLVMCITGFERLELYLPWLLEMAAERQERAGLPLNPIAEWASIVSELDSLHDMHEAWKTLLSNGAVISATAAARGDQWLLGIPSSPKDRATIELWLQADTPVSFKGSDVFHFEKRNWYSTWKNGFWYCAPNKSMIEEVILRESQIVSPLIEHSFGLMSVDVPLHFLAPVDNDGWIQLDPLFAEGQRKLSGYFIPSDSASTLLNFSPGAGIGGIAVASLLPSHTSALCVWSASSSDDAQVRAAEYFAGTPHETYWSAATPMYSDSCQCIVDDALNAWRGHEWGTAILSRGDSIHYPVMFYQKRDTSSALSFIRPLLTDSVSNVRIHTVRYPDLFRKHEISLVPVEHRYTMERGGFVFFAEIPDVLQELMVVNDTTSLYTERLFSRAMNTIDKETECSFYGTTFSVGLLPEALNRAFAGSGCELVTVKRGGGGLPLVSIHFPEDQAKSVPPAVQQAAPEPPATGMREWSVINHTTGRTEKVVVSANGKLEWMNADGQTVWNRTLEGNIMGDIVQVDLLKNGKLQLLFNTSTALIAIDKNGNDVAGFPVKVPTTAVAPVSVFDYDKNNTYRFLLPLSDGSVLNIGNNGLPTEGWKYEADKPVRWIGHLRTGSEDHLLVVDSEGKVTDCKRNGQVRSVFPKLQSAPEGGFRLETGTTLQESKLRYYTKDGVLQTHYFE
jgi:hypothetical protein